MSVWQLIVRWAGQSCSHTISSQQTAVSNQQSATSSQQLAVHNQQSTMVIASCPCGHSLKAKVGLVETLNMADIVLAGTAHMGPFKYCICCDAVGGLPCWASFWQSAGGWCRRQGLPTTLSWCCWRWWRTHTTCHATGAHVPTQGRSTATSRPSFSSR